MVDMGYRFRIYPNRRQRLLIERTFGCTRWVWNHFLNKRQVEYEETGRSSRAFRQMKDLPKLKDANPWLREVDSVSLQAVIQHLDRAYDNFYRRVTSKKKGGYKGTTGYPRFQGQAQQAPVIHDQKRRPHRVRGGRQARAPAQTRHGQNQGQPSRDRRGQIRDRQP